MATILSAQTTDEAVNKITPLLFASFPDPQKLALAQPGILESTLRPLGLSRVKSKNIRESAAKLVSDHESRVPDSMEALLELRGLGRKTAWVILGECFNSPGIVVDTHMARVTSRRDSRGTTGPKKLSMISTAGSASGLEQCFPIRSLPMAGHYAWLEPLSVGTVLLLPIASIFRSRSRHNALKGVVFPLKGL